MHADTEQAEPTSLRSYVSNHSKSLIIKNQEGREFHSEKESLLKKYQTGGNPGPTVQSSRRNRIRFRFRVPHPIKWIRYDKQDLVAQEPFSFISLRMVMPSLNCGISSLFTIS